MQGIDLPATNESAAPKQEIHTLPDQARDLFAVCVIIF